MSPIITSPVHHNVGDSETQRCQSLNGSHVSGTKYGFQLARVDDSNLCAVRALGINLSTRMITFWDRGKVKVNRLLCSTHSPARSMAGPTCLPYEILEMIAAHLTRDLNALKACSLTCRSWYIVAVPYLHHTLTLGGYEPGTVYGRLNPLSELHELGLVPLVKEIRVRQWVGIISWFLPQAFNRNDLRYFSAFANVQTLVLQRLRAARPVHTGY